MTERCPVCGKKWKPCQTCKGTGKGDWGTQGDYGECGVCSGDGDVHDCTG